MPRLYVGATRAAHVEQSQWRLRRESGPAHSDDKILFVGLWRRRRRCSRRQPRRRQPHVRTCWRRVQLVACFAESRRRPVGYTSRTGTPSTPKRRSCTSITRPMCADTGATPASDEALRTHTPRALADALLAQVPAHRRQGPAQGHQRPRGESAASRAPGCVVAHTAANPAPRSSAVLAVPDGPAAGSKADREAQQHLHHQNVREGPGG